MWFREVKTKIKSRRDISREENELLKYIKSVSNKISKELEKIQHLSYSDDEKKFIKNRASSSKWTSGQIDCFWHSPDIEDYEPKRWSDLEFNKITC